MDKIIIYTDGGCRGNPGIGGWGAWLRYKKLDKKIRGGAKNTTNNQMEITAAIKALELLKDNNIDVDLYTDSKYVINGISNWISNWKKNNWKTANKKAVKNAELWRRLDELNMLYNVNWLWVKGHSGNKGNDMADLLANQAMDELQ